jgi:phage major head subunit gpT-like protein
MGITVTRELVRNTTAGARVIFADAFQAQSGIAGIIATTLPSTQNTETYTWLSEMPQMREFIDERAIRALNEYSYSLRNRTFEATIGIEREALEDDQFGQLRMRVLGLAEAAHSHYDQLVFTLIKNGEVEKGYDGKPFFSAAHKVGGQNVSNLSTAPLTADNLAAALTGMSTIPLDNGEPMMVRPTHLLVPPALRWTAKRLLNSAFYPEATSVGKPGDMAANVLHGELELLVSPRLTSATEWYVLDCSHPVKPFLLQQRLAPELEALDGTDGASETAFLRDVFLYGVRSRDNAGYGLWQYAFKSTGAGA